mgnify:CR=1 FL=1
MLYFLLAAALVVLDQVVKLLVRHNIPLGGSVTLIPGVMDLSYVQNTGAAFSLFQEHTWVLAAVSLIVAVLLILALIKKIFTRPWGVISLAVVLAGAVGNLIDRVFLGFVTDMFQTTFMNFPVAFFWQLIYAGPIVRFIFRHIFPEKENVKEATATM